MELKEEDYIIISDVTYQFLMKQDEPIDLLGLLWFYRSVEKWGTQKMTVSYIMKSLHWGAPRVKRVRQTLINFNLIEDTTRKKVS